MKNQNECANMLGGIILILFVLFSLVTIGCITNSNSTSSSSEPTVKFVRCEKPRPEICTQDYVPVCGELIDGSQKTYSNACSACSNINVIKYQLNSCQ
jgi:hypothetical protein